MALFQDSGSTAEQRVAEAHVICKMLEDALGGMENREMNFVESMADCAACSPKQLFWLRDIKEKYL